MAETPNIEVSWPWALGTIGAVMLAGVWVGDCGSGPMEDRLKEQEKKLQQLNETLAEFHGVSPGTISREDLEPFTDRAKYDKPVTSEQAYEVASSTVSILSIPKDKEGEPLPNCTGTKVSFGYKQDNFVLTSEHCLNFNVRKNEYSEDTEALDVLPYDSNDYAIGGATTTSPTRNFTPVAWVRRAAVNVVSPSEPNNNDPNIALLKVERTPDFDQIPAMPVSRFTNTTQGPYEIQQAYMYSLPSAISRLAVSAVGTYVGRLKQSPIYDGGAVDVVGFKAKDARKNPCIKGGSGASAILAQNPVLGPFQFRTDSTTEKNLPVEGRVEPEISSGIRARIEDGLKFDLSGFNVLCGFTVPQKDTLTTLHESLQKTT